jgi:hypothetical protein
MDLLGGVDEEKEKCKRAGRHGAQLEREGQHPFEQCAEALGV